MTSPPPGNAATATDEFFASLASRGQEPLLKHTTATIRFDLVDDQDRLEHWYVTIGDGDVDVSHRDDLADAVLHLRRDTFDGLATGHINAIAATLRGRIVPEGDLGLVVLFQRLFPGPPRAGSGRAVTTGSTTP